MVHRHYGPQVDLPGFVIYETFHILDLDVFDLVFLRKFCAHNGSQDADVLFKAAIGMLLGKSR
jgi:hypothetical protein